jgi:hypothetical protein
MVSKTEDQNGPPLHQLLLRKHQISTISIPTEGNDYSDPTFSNKKQECKKTKDVKKAEPDNEIN